MLSIGIIGLPNVGKSTLFNTLTNQQALVANYPFATIEPNSGIVPVPDERLTELAKLYNTSKIIPSTINFIDIAGLVKGASKGEGLGNQFLGHIRNVNALVLVSRLFEDSNIQHVNNQINPLADIDIILTELKLADLDTLNKYLVKLQKELKANPKLQSKFNDLTKLSEHLNQDLEIDYLTPEQKASFYDLNLLSLKPIIYVFNIGLEPPSEDIKKTILTNQLLKHNSLFIPIKLESELASLLPTEAAELRTEYGFYNDPPLTELVKSAFMSLGLQTFLTAGEKEVRSWTIKKGATAPQAAGVIHSDFEKGFIAAEVVKYKDLIQYGSLSACRKHGLIHSEGKTYIVQEDDIIEFRFNV